MDEKMLNKGKNNQIDSILQDNGIQTFNTSIQQIGFDSSVNESVNSFQGIKNQLNLLLELNDNIKFSTFELNQSIHEFVINQFDIDKFNDAINAEIEKGNSLPLWLKDYLKLPFFKSLLVELFRKFPNSAVLMHCYKLISFGEQEEVEIIEEDTIMEDISTIFTINENEYEDYCNQFMDKYTESNKICLKVIYYLREINNEYPTSLILHDINNRMIEKLSLVCNNYEEFKSLLNLLMEIKDNDILSFCFNKNIHNLKTMQLIQKFYSITTQQEDLEFNRKLAIPYVINKLITITILSNKPNDTKSEFNQSLDKGLYLLCYLTTVNPLTGRGLPEKARQIGFELKLLWKTKLYALCEISQMYSIPSAAYRDILLAKVILMYIMNNIDNIIIHKQYMTSEEPIIYKLIEDIARIHKPLQREAFNCLLKCLDKCKKMEEKYQNECESMLYESIMNLFAYNLIKPIIDHLRLKIIALRPVLIKSLVFKILEYCQPLYTVYFIKNILLLIYDMELLLKKCSVNDLFLISTKRFLDLASNIKNYHTINETLESITAISFKAKELATKVAQIQ